ncbi:GNAT family N-acetyltransferase [Halalkalicoccus jeotgali]|uniref:GCN5-like N-acetyltransferase n=1 Tax=Halalkalicoccus jeotgali (strain DSM 18796 / CECT 7217 / JCM 14584 / KCTC 4019 / B3) TaxID=795797 RepID=D8J540_HALJB|nr:GNAT family N-acetyltransferase [Halalkalicoccus jeotgali]ADJ13621.1 GCN5-related N-acetyltransferase [Halalkalicoccus jeotgali B3]ELY33357.1 GCN5-like N-acetyltransferase [Halalkalicoccus jeotgali B3]
MIREAREGESEAVMRVLEGALLESDPDAVRGAIDRGDVLVAREAGHVRGALVLDGNRVAAVAVARRHRAKGLGSALIERAGERGVLIADFRPAVRPFYESLGFEIECEETRSDGTERRYRGRLGGQDS